MAYKECLKCHVLCGPRTLICSNCKNPFNANKFSKVPKAPKALRVPKVPKVPKIRKALKVPTFLKKKKGHEIDWTELEHGDIIRVISGEGPYMMIDGEKVLIGYSGKFKVIKLDSTGIHAYPVKAKESGHCYIYMGPEKKCHSGTVLVKHKIRRLKNVSIL